MEDSKMPLGELNLNRPPTSSSPMKQNTTKLDIPLQKDGSRSDTTEQPAFDGNNSPEVQQLVDENDEIITEKVQPIALVEADSQSTDEKPRLSAEEETNPDESDSDDLIKISSKELQILPSETDILEAESVNDKKEMMKLTGLFEEDGDCSTDEDFDDLSDEHFTDMESDNDVKTNSTKNEQTASAPVSEEEVNYLKFKSQYRLKHAWEKIIKKYGRSFEGETDEIDLVTGKVGC
jgi:hypothetical protein